MQKRQEFPPGIGMVATPIGNLSDMTPRAIAYLEQADWIWAEDTRQCQKLFQALGLVLSGKKIERVDRHTQNYRINELVATAKAKGLRVAVVSDAGTPGIADPGARAVSAAVLADFPVFPIPGVSAVAALASIAGSGGSEFCFMGFFPREKKDKETLRRVFDSEAQVLIKNWVWFESPERIESTLLWWKNEFPECRLVLAKELTKKWEKVFYGCPELVLNHLQSLGIDNVSRGEYCFWVDFSEWPEKSEPDGAKSIFPELFVKEALECGVSVASTSKLAKRLFPAAKLDFYKMALDSKSGLKK